MSNKNNCSNNHRVNCSTLQDGGGNKGLRMTLFTSADCFKKRRESRASPSVVSGERKGKKERRGREGGQERKRDRTLARDERG